MCGISGFSPPGQWGLNVLERMTESLLHRGPDGGGSFIDERIAFGQRRLTVIDPIGGAQPRVDVSSGDVLIYNGEIYGYREHAAELVKLGAKLKDNSDTEVLFHALRQYGVMGALERLSGMFAFAYREGATGKIYLARDRFGEKPLFYGVVAGTLIFGSEIKALLRHPALASAQYDAQEIDRYLSFEFLCGAQTGFREIRKVEPGHVVVFDRGSLSTTEYWSPQYRSAPSMSEEDAIERLDQLLHRAVEKQLIADVPVGVFLSGGVDSSLVAAIARRYSPSITAYTIKMTDASFDESSYASVVARHCGLRHKVHEFGADDVVRAFDALVDHVDEPMADYSLLPTYLVCKLARQQETVALGGDGGDELFAGYGTFRARRFSALMACVPPFVGRISRAVMDKVAHSESYMSTGFVLRQLSIGFGESPEHQSLLWLAPFSADERLRLWCPDRRPKDTGKNLFAEVDHILSRLSTSLSPVERILDLYRRTYLPDDILAKVDRCAMAVSLETRTPYLDRHVADFVMSLPDHWKVRGGQTKYLLKKLAERYLPREIVHRKKQGFGFPLGEFLRTALRSRCREILLDRTNPVAAWFKRSEIERYFNEHEARKKDHRKKIWALLILFASARRKAAAEGAISGTPA